MANSDLETIYNGRPLRSMLYDDLEQTIHIDQISYNGSHLQPEKVMRIVHIYYQDFIKFHDMLDETLKLYEEWRTSLITKFTIKGGWAIHKEPIQLAKVPVLSLTEYARWFWFLPNGNVMCCLFTQNEIEDLVLTDTETHFNGVCTMNVEFFFLY